jgi:sucrose-phosphate synthase
MKSDESEPEMHTSIASASSLFFSDIDNTLILEASAEQPGLTELRNMLANRGSQFIFAVATGRSLAGVRHIFEEHRLPEPDLVIASVGTQIYRGLDGELDNVWEKHIAFEWDAAAMQGLESVVPGIRPQEPHRQGRFKVSYYVDASAFDVQVLTEALAKSGSRANPIITQGRFLDLLPPRASKGRAIRHLAARLGIPLSRSLAAGDAGNDRDMLETAGRAIVVANHSAELSLLAGRPGVFFSSGRGAAGILDGMAHHHFPFA